MYKFIRGELQMARLLTKEDRLAIGDNLTHFRRIRGYRQEEVAHLMNVTRECVTMWEKGVRTPDVISLARLCRILKVTIYDVIDNLI